MPELSEPPRAFPYAQKTAVLNEFVPSPLKTAVDFAEDYNKRNAVQENPQRPITARLLGKWTDEAREYPERFPDLKVEIPDSIYARHTHEERVSVLEKWGEARKAGRSQRGFVADYNKENPGARLTVPTLNRWVKEPQKVLRGSSGSGGRVSEASGDLGAGHGGYSAGGQGSTYGQAVARIRDLGIIYEIACSQLESKDPSANYFFLEYADPSSYGQEDAQGYDAAGGASAAPPNPHASYAFAAPDVYVSGRSGTRGGRPQGGADSTYPSNPHAWETAEYTPWPVGEYHRDGTSSGYQKPPAIHSNQGKPNTQGPTP